MTKQEAIEAMHQGHKVTHENFSDEEFIYHKNGEMHDEKDYNINSEFWMWRHQASWLNGWSIYDLPA